MKDADRTKEHLISELGELRQRITELERLEVQGKSAERAIQEAYEYAERDRRGYGARGFGGAGWRVESDFGRPSFYRTFNVTAEETEGRLILWPGRHAVEHPQAVGAAEGSYEGITSEGTDRKPLRGFWQLLGGFCPLVLDKGQTPRKEWRR